MRSITWLELAILVLVITSLSGCSSIGIGEPTGGNALVKVYIVEYDNETNTAGQYKTSDLTDISKVNETVNTALSHSGRIDSGSGPILGTATVELSKKRVDKVKSALKNTNNTGRTGPTGSKYPPGMYFEHGNRYVVIELRIYS
jgi:uncharacterized protein YceK